MTVEQCRREARDAGSSCKAYALGYDMWLKRPQADMATVCARIAYRYALAAEYLEQREARRLRRAAA